MQQEWAQQAGKAQADKAQADSAQGAHGQGADRHDRAAWRQDAPAWAYSAFLVFVLLTGGSSRADSIGQPIVRAISILFVAVLAMVWRPAEWRSLRLPIGFVAVVTLMVAAMLVPVPPGIWTALPGRDLIARAAPLLGIAQPWRPLAISPPLAVNALFALIPAIAALVGLVYLTPLQRARLVSTMVVLVLASAVLGLAQMSAGTGLGWYGTADRDAGAGLFANRNHEALFLALGFPMLAIWGTSSAIRHPTLVTRRWLATGVTVFLCLAIPTTGSRAGLALGAIGLLVIGVLCAAAIRRGVHRLPARWRLASFAAALGAIVLVFVVALTFRQATSVQRLFSLDVGADERAMALSTLKAVAARYFPVGTGFGGFEPAFRAAEPFALLKFTYLNAAHNDFLQLAIEGGAAGLALLAAFVGWWLYRSVVVWRMATAVSHVRLARAGSAMVFMTLLASATDYPVRTPSIMVTLILACAWMQLPRNRSVPR
ncbi:O-antigen ligase family protein [Sphingomonas oligophenolica]|uniref:O-antigen ligase domain-containing protein n=1 Tax=Sphingomonas oligophenolica TaxID=301154 RepID=A0A502CGE6_9SPHN|nr:O-antigen ligase family protein [Sphingomonas oligophenolica]TPG10846.1 O-antigen ligase domain-containing protein [Sphingomonas oligophenolica]